MSPLPLILGCGLAVVGITIRMDMSNSGTMNSNEGMAVSLTVMILQDHRGLVAMEIMTHMTMDMDMDMDMDVITEEVVMEVDTEMVMAMDLIITTAAGDHQDGMVMILGMQVLIPTLSLSPSLPYFIV